jgi:hypothetical protein
VGRLRIAEEIGQRVEKKMVWKNVDILNIVENTVQWTTAKKKIFSNDKSLILNFG